jgi:sulfatase maturation enzyme AslB (radical SAM superfamily)
MLVKLVKLCHERGVTFSFRVSIDGVGQVHNDLRQVPHGFDKANGNIQAMQTGNRNIDSTSPSPQYFFPRTSTTLKTF